MRYTQPMGVDLLWDKQPVSGPTMRYTQPMGEDLLWDTNSQQEWLTWDTHSQWEWTYNEILTANRSWPIMRYTQPMGVDLIWDTTANRSDFHDIHTDNDSWRTMRYTLTMGVDLIWDTHSQWVWFYHELKKWTCSTLNNEILKFNRYGFTMRYQEFVPVLYCDILNINTFGSPLRYIQYHDSQMDPTIGHSVIDTEGPLSEYIISPIGGFHIKAFDWYTHSSLAISLAYRSGEDGGIL
jgi:hypothetical protein